MPLSVKSWHLREFLSRVEESQLDLSPEYQRREAWNAKKKMVLIDSIARRIPINAITLYRTEKSGVPVYEVIDGKQRLTAVVQFKQGKLAVVSESITGLSEEEEREGAELAAKIVDKKWDGLDPGTKATFLEYEVPIYLVEGPRASAVRAFRRMNEEPYALNPQEIRNAIFKDSEFLHATQKLEKSLRDLAPGADPFLVEWGLVTPDQWRRMRDLQFLSELLCLQLDGPQEARRTLDDFYSNYFAPHGKSLKKLETAVEQTGKAIRAAHSLVGGNLKACGFEKENDLYALIGAILQRGIPTKPQLSDENATMDVRGTLTLLREQVLLYQDAMRNNDEAEAEQYGEEVKAYGATLISGQINSANRRQTRIDLLAQVISERIKPIDPKNVTDLQRRLVWARSPDKKCGRCEKIVKWED
ncbi:MAG: DUF262 domain-containing protein [Verrucomicrobia bacterium]|nr:DUF262 domain-containing protein [Verrucomicrobiota bacterium]